MENLFATIATSLILIGLIVLIGWAVYRRIKELLLTKGSFSKYAGFLTILFGVCLILATLWVIIVMFLNFFQ